MGASCDNKDKSKFKIEINSEIKNGVKSEIFTTHKPIPVKIINKVMKSICKITIETKKGVLYGTGFFLNYSNTKKFLVTNYHVINPNLEYENIKVEIYDKTSMKLKLKNRLTKYIKKPKDIAMIEIRESDNIYNHIEFLDYDINYINKGYSIYENVDIFSIEHPYGDDASCASGKIIKINDFEFEHDVPTDDGSSGCPIILLNNNINFIQVIGIHKEGNYIKKLNYGTFLGEILNKELKKDKNENKNNYIVAEIYINDEDINKIKRILNSYEEHRRGIGEIKENFKNEDEIKRCQIEINEEKIKFSYYHKFKLKGNFKIKYIFKTYITSTRFMFCDCSFLTQIDLSNFNINYITDMGFMFCDCFSLTKINLSNFITDNVTDMWFLFCGCSSLTDIDLSNFNTKKVTNMGSMFSKCSSLIDIDLSNFNTKNVTYMKQMFFNCSSLTKIDLSFFDTDNVTDMDDIFYGCSSLVKKNVITKEKRLLNEI